VAGEEAYDDEAHIQRARVPHFSRFLREVGRWWRRGTWDYSSDSLPHLQNLPVANSNGSGFSVGVGSKAAPRPLIGFLNQVALHRIAVHVAQLLGALVLGPYVEIIEAELPDVGRRRALPQVSEPA
jgi:hypothetical protein